MSDIVQLRRDIEDEWKSRNPILAEGEVAITMDLTPKRLKIGNGGKWADTEYLVLPSEDGGDMMKSEYDTGGTSGVHKVDNSRLADTAILTGDNLLINGDMYYWQRGSRPISIISRSRTSSINTYNTDRPHGYFVGDSIQVTGLSGKNISSEKCSWFMRITSVNSLTSFSVLVGWGTSSAITANQTTVSLGSFFGNTESFPFNIKIEKEEMTVTGRVGNVFTVTRGVNGTTAVAHATELPVAPTDEPLVTENGLSLLTNRFSIWLSAGQFTYTADRKLVINGTDQDCIISRNRFPSGTSPCPSKHFMRINFNVAPTTGYIGVNELIEDVDELSGKTVTMSGYCKTPAEEPSLWLSLGQVYGTNETPIYMIGAKTFKTPISWQRFTNTVTLPSTKGKSSNSASYTQFAITFDPRSSGSYELACLKLEENIIATPFKKVDKATELVKCQRYFEKSYSEGQSPSLILSGNGTMFNSPSVNCLNYNPFKVAKRRACENTVYSHQTGTKGMVYNAYTYTDIPCQAGWYGENGFHLLGFTSVVGNEYRYHWTAEAELMP